MCWSFRSFPGGLFKRFIVQNSNRLCENSEFGEKWLVSIKILRFVEPVIDENRRKSAEIH